jgi:hypothetical protein
MCRTHSELLPKRGRHGAKDYSPATLDEDGQGAVATQQTKLEASRSEWSDLASALRTPAIRSLSVGIWDAEHSVVELVVQKGSHFKGTGWHDKQRGVRLPSRPAPPIVLGTLLLRALLSMQHCER